MPSFRFNKHCCQKEKEHNKNLKHYVHNPHRYVTQLTDHEKCIENLSNLNLQQGTICSKPTCKTSCCSKPTCKTPCSDKRSSQSSCKSQSDKRTEVCCSQIKLRHKKSTCSSAKKKSRKPTSSEICYPVPKRTPSTARCKGDFVWQTAKYVRDECGSGIVPLRLEISDPRRIWCKTPLTMYQSTIGELARKMLCNEIVVRKRVNTGPPCNLCEYVMPMCKGYYRKYECRRSCEENHAQVKNGVKVYRDAIQQYWMPCLTTEEKREYDLSRDAEHNVYLGKKLKRQVGDGVYCW